MKTYYEVSTKKFQKPIFSVYDKIKVVLQNAPIKKIIITTQQFFNNKNKKRVNYTINKHTIDRFKVVADKDMRKMSNIVENLIR